MPCVLQTIHQAKEKVVVLSLLLRKFCPIAVTAFITAKVHIEAKITLVITLWSISMDSMKNWFPAAASVRVWWQLAGRTRSNSCLRDCKRLFITSRIKEFTELVRHCFELLECRSIAITLDACFALIAGYCLDVKTLILAADKTITVVALMEWLINCGLIPALEVIPCSMLSSVLSSSFARKSL